ncbi:MAG: nucleotidyltransferase family protein [Acidimicrobiales bacterium]
MAAKGRQAVIEQLSESAAHALSAYPDGALILFGSMARGDACTESDLDVLAVRPLGLGCDDDDWDDLLVDWRIQAHEETGRTVDLIDAEADEIPLLLGRAGPCVWHDIAREGVVLAGRPLGALVSAR